MPATAATFQIIAEALQAARDSIHAGVPADNLLAFAETALDA